MASVDLTHRATDPEGSDLPPVMPDDLPPALLADSAGPQLSPIERAERQARVDLDIPDAPVGIPPSFADHVALQFELLTLAFTADMTRVFTFMTGREASQRTYPDLGMSETHHDTSHHGRQPDKMAQHAKVNTYFSSLFAEFLEQLRASPEGDGSRAVPRAEDGLDGAARWGQPGAASTSPVGRSDSGRLTRRQPPPERA